MLPAIQKSAPKSPESQVSKPAAQPKSPAATQSAKASTAASPAAKPAATTQLAKPAANYFRDDFTAKRQVAMDITGGSLRTTANALVQQTRWVDPTGQNLTMQQYYTQRAMAAAGIDPAQWDPSRGF